MTMNVNTFSISRSAAESQSIIVTFNAQCGHIHFCLSVSEGVRPKWEKMLPLPPPSIRADA